MKVYSFIFTHLYLPSMGLWALVHICREVPDLFSGLLPRRRFTGAVGSDPHPRPTASADSSVSQGDDS